MKNTIKVFGIIAIVAVIGFSMAACGDEPTNDPDPVWTYEEREVTTVGRLTITGLSDYNGKIIRVTGISTTSPVVAFKTAYNRYNFKDGNLESISPGADDQKVDRITITGGQVTFKVFRAPSMEPYESYNGNDQNVYIFGIDIFDRDWDDQNPNATLLATGTGYVNFTNGIATLAFVPHQN